MQLQNPGHLFKLSLQIIYDPGPSLEVQVRRLRWLCQKLDSVLTIFILIWTHASARCLKIDRFSFLTKEQDPDLNSDVSNFLQDE